MRFWEYVLGVLIGLLACIGLGVVLIQALTGLFGEAACAAPNCTIQTWLTAVGTVAAALLTVLVLWRTLGQMQRSSEQQLRAYVYVEQATIGRLNGNEAFVAFSIRNFGATPARRCTLACTISLDAEGDGAGLLQPARRNLGDIAPGQFLTAEFKLVPVFTDPAVLPRLHRREAGIWVVVAIEYDAIQPERRTAARYGYPPNGPVNELALVEPIWST